MTRLFPKDSKLTGQLLNEVRGIEGLNGVTILATTNKINDLEESIKSIFEIKMEIPKPDFNARKEIFEIELRGKPVKIDYDELARESEGLTGMEITLKCKRAIIKAMKNSEFLIRKENFYD